MNLPVKNNDYWFCIVKICKIVMKIAKLYTHPGSHLACAMVWRGLYAVYIGIIETFLYFLMLVLNHMKSKTIYKYDLIELSCGQKLDNNKIIISENL